MRGHRNFCGEFSALQNFASRASDAFSDVSELLQQLECSSSPALSPSAFYGATAANVECNNKRESRVNLQSIPPMKNYCPEWPIHTAQDEFRVV